MTQHNLFLTTFVISTKSDGSDVLVCNRKVGAAVAGCAAGMQVPIIGGLGGALGGNATAVVLPQKLDNGKMNVPDRRQSVPEVHREGIRCETLRVNKTYIL